MSSEVRVLAFSSPKGGVGRTMTAANIAAIYAAGASAVGIDATPTLIIDFDLESPGVHYYDFAAALVSAGVPACTYEVDGNVFRTPGELVGYLRDTGPFGVAALLAALRTSEGFADAILPLSTASDRPPGEAHAEATTALVTLLRRETESSSLSNPLRHIIRISDASGTTRLVILPAGEPANRAYRSAVLAFSWRDFFENAGGMAVIDALVRFFHSGIPALPAIRRVLLDQDAGLSLPAVANQYLAQTRIVVSGFSAQNQQGLFSLLDSALKAGGHDDLRVVLSQYGGRDTSYAESAQRVEVSYDAAVRQRVRFLDYERLRASILATLNSKHVAPEAVYVTDFCQTAVQFEYFFPIESPSWNALARLIASLEQSYSPSSPAIEVGTRRRLCVLGEFVGSVDAAPNGPLAGFRAYLTDRLGADVSVETAATDHDTIAELVKRGNVSLRPTTPLDSTFCKYEEGGDKNYRLSDFDIVAMPVYLVSLAVQAGLLARLEPLWRSETFFACDSAKPVDDEYLKNAIAGWETYTHASMAGGERTFVGYPLFIAYQLIASNSRSIWSDAFAENYLKYEYRHFRGFHDPADILAVARAASVNQVPCDRLIMTLERTHIAQWYEWQAILSIFGTTDAEITTPWDELGFSPQLLNDRTIEATVYYLELVTYAAKDSSTFDWNDAIRAFYDEERVGFSIIWPDAVPTESREGTGLPFVYHVPPGDRLHEECWLLTIPSGRGDDRPSVKDLQLLLTDFLTFESQRQYQARGGITVHRRVLQDLDRWRECQYLPELRHIGMDTTIRRRAATSQAREFAEHVAQALAQLRERVKRLLEEERNRRGVEAHESIDYVWRDRTFTEGVATVVRSEFARVQEAFTVIADVATAG